MPACRSNPFVLFPEGWRNLPRAELGSRGRGCESLLAGMRLQTLSPVALTDRVGLKSSGYEEKISLALQIYYMRVLMRPQPLGRCLTCTGEGVRGALARFGWGFRFRKKRKNGRGMCRLTEIRQVFRFLAGRGGDKKIVREVIHSVSLYSPGRKRKL